MRLARILYTNPFRPLLTPIRPIRSFTNTTSLFAKGGKKSKKDVKKTNASEPESSPSAGDIIDLSDARTKFETILDKFNKKAAEIKLGKTNPNIFDQLDIKNQDDTFKFNTIAQTSIKGRNLIITVFDPSQTKNIVSAILDSDLNMNPTHDPSSGVLKVPLPPITTETKNEQVKVLKQAFEKFKNNNLNAIRTDYKQKLKKVSKKNDDDKKLFNEFESLHKEFSDKLQTQFKSTEKLIMK